MFRSRIHRVWGHAAIFAYSSCTAAASSLGCSRPPPAPRARVATPVQTSRTMTSSTPSPRVIPDAAFTPVRGGRTATLMSGVSRGANISQKWSYLFCTLPSSLPSSGINIVRHPLTPFSWRSFCIPVASVRRGATVQCRTSRFLKENHSTDTRGTIRVFHPALFGIVDILFRLDTIGVFHPAPFGIVDILDAFDIRERTTSTWSSTPRHRSHCSFDTTYLCIDATVPALSPTKSHAVPAHAAPAYVPDNAGTAVTPPTAPRTSALPGTTVPASSPDTFALLLSALTVLLQLRASPAPPLLCLPPRAPCSLHPATEHTLISIPTTHDTPLLRCAPTVV